MDALDGLVDLAKRILLRGEQAESEIAVKYIGACVGHVSAESGLLIQRIFRQIRLAVEQFVSKLDQMGILLSPPRRHFCRNGALTQYIFCCSAGLSPCPALSPGLHSMILAQPTAKSNGRHRRAAYSPNRGATK